MLRPLLRHIPFFNVAVLASAAALAGSCAPSAIAQGGLSDPTFHTAALNRDPLVQQGFERFYNMDYDGALDIFRKVQEQHPQDPLAVDYVLSDIIFRELNREDLLDTTLYAHEGFLTSNHLKAEDPKVKAEIDRLSEQAISLADSRIKANPNDVDALFARAMAKSLKATYIGLAERGFIGGLHLALSARSDDEHVLQIDPNYIDAKLVVGIHSYVVGALPLPLKMMAGMVGIHGDKKAGIAMLEECGKHGVITSVEARTTLMIFLRHDARYADAIQVARSLMAQYPHDYLFNLEVANLLKDSGNGPAAVKEYHSVLDLAARPGYFSSAHIELAWFGLAETLRGQNDLNGALAAFRNVLAQPNSSPDLRSRANAAVNELQSKGAK
jgi:tetratricopeptide (TPR) repeat protein